VEGFQFGLKTRSNLSVDLGYHVGDPVYLSSQIAKTAKTEIKTRKTPKADRYSTVNVRQIDLKYQTVRGVPFG